MKILAFRENPRGSDLYCWSCFMVLRLWNTQTTNRSAYHSCRSDSDIAASNLRIKIKEHATNENTLPSQVNMTNPAQYFRWFITYKLTVGRSCGPHVRHDDKKYVHIFTMLALTVVIFIILSQQALLQLSEEFT